MADQEFLASFAVEIDESGVARLQSVLEENRKLADSLSAAFSAASGSVRAFAAELSADLPGLVSGTGYGITTEGIFGNIGGLEIRLDLAEANRSLKAFTDAAKKPVPLSADASAVIASARNAYAGVRSIFAVPVTLRARVEKTVTGPDGAGDTPLPKLSSGGRFSRPSEVQVAEDGDAEYIIPVKKEERAVPLLRQLLAELSPAARESLSAGDVPSLAGGLAAGAVPAGSVIQDNRTVSAPVSIEVHASGANAEQIGRSVYDTAERYLLRTMEGVFT